MNAVEEEIPLPDPEVQPLVHPLDLSEARPSFRTGWLIGALTSLPVATLLAGLLGYLGHTVLGPIALFLALVVLGTLASRWHLRRSWDFIPRKRQDRERPLPRLWELTSAAVQALVLGGALLVVVFRLDNDDVSFGVRAYTFGAALVVALLVLADTVIGLSRPARRRRAIAGLPGAVVVLVATAVAYGRWFDGDASSPELVWGAVTLALAAVAAGAGRRFERRRATA